MYFTFLVSLLPFLEGKSFLYFNLELILKCVCASNNFFCSAQQIRQNGDSFYLIFNNNGLHRMNWNDARAECLRRGYDLVTIDSKEEDDYLRTFVV